MICNQAVGASEKGAGAVPSERSWQSEASVLQLRLHKIGALPPLAGSPPKHTAD